VGRSRSLIFIPGNNQRFLEKSRTINSDIVCYDLEDSVPQEEKEIARETVRSTIQEFNKINDINKERILAVRINSPTSNQVAADLKKNHHPGN
jgi:citrate lyase subunit beta/citryl-CoA lyase